MNLKTQAAKVRAKSVRLDVYGGILTALLSALGVFLATPEFEALIMQWFASNPVLGAAAMVFITTVVIEVMKAFSNAAAISKADTVYAASADEVTLV